MSLLLDAAFKPKFDNARFDANFIEGECDEL